MSLKEYLERHLPNYEQLLSEEDMNKVALYWESAEKSRKAADYCLDMQFKSKAGIDYSTDFEKNNEEYGRKILELNEFLKSLTILKDNTIVDDSKTLR